MDSRIALEPAAPLRLVNREGGATLYTILREIGRGASSLVYEASYEATTGDRKLVRIKECYPHKLNIRRLPDGSLLPAPEDEASFEAAKRKLRSDFSVSNGLFYAEGLQGTFVDQLDVHDCNNTSYIVSAFSSEKTLANYRPPTVRECVTLVRQVAYVLCSIHREGYLYLDIKPDNVLVIEGLPTRIQLFDFDSLVPIAAARGAGSADCADVRLSYSQGFAPVELQTGRLRRLGPHTDVFGIGALLFYLLFGTTPDAMDCEQDAAYDFSRMTYDARCFDDKLFDALTGFFRRALASYYLDRCRTMQEAFDLLCGIERCADTTVPRVLSSAVRRPPLLIGRERELARLDELLGGEGGVLFVTGMGGIGKSSLVREYAATRRARYDTMLYVQFAGTMEQTIASDRNVTVTTLRQSEERRAGGRYFDRKLRKLRELLQGTASLLVIDHFTGEVDEDFLAVLETPWKVMVVTRQAPPLPELPALTVSALAEPEALRALFEHHLGRRVRPEELAAFESLAARAAGHTLLLALIARQIAASRLTLAEAESLAAAHGLTAMSPEQVDYAKDSLPRRGTIGDIVDALFEASALSAEKRTLLKAASLLPAEGYDARALCGALRLPSLDALNELSRDGWLLADGDAVSLHPVIREAVRRWEWRRDWLDAAELLLSHCAAGLSAAAAPCRLDAQGNPSPDAAARARRLDALLAQAEGILAECRREPPVRAGRAYAALLRAAVLAMPLYREDFLLPGLDELLRLPGDEASLARMELFRFAAALHAEAGRFEEAESVLREAKRAARGRAARAVLLDARALLLDAQLGGAYDAVSPRERKLLRRLLRSVGGALRLSRGEEALAESALETRSLLAKAAILLRSGRARPKKIGRLLARAESALRETPAPLAAVRLQELLVSGWYEALVLADGERTRETVARILALSAHSSASQLDEIDDAVVPCANMLVELGLFPEAAKLLRHGIGLARQRGASDACRRRKRELYGHLIETALLSELPDLCRSVLEEVRRENALAPPGERLEIPDALCAAALPPGDTE